MTNKEWNKLRLQVALRKVVPTKIVLNDTGWYTGWCSTCKNLKGDTEKRNDAEGSVCIHYGKECRGRLIPTVDTDGCVIEYTWFTYYYPKEFSDD